MSFAFNPHQGLIIVHAEIWGASRSAVLSLALDTGATFTLVNQGRLMQLGYDPAVTPKYEERTAEYADIDDWVRTLGLRYARHLMEAPPRQDIRELMKAEFSVMYFMGEVTRIFPEFFKLKPKE